MTHTFLNILKGTILEHPAVQNLPGSYFQSYTYTLSQIDEVIIYFEFASA